MDDVVSRLKETAASMLPAATPGAVLPPITRNDLTPVAEGLTAWVKELTAALEAERLAHARTQSPHQVMRVSLEIYQAVAQSMAFKGKEAEHQIAKQRMNDIIDAGLRAWREMVAPDTG